MLRRPPAITESNRRNPNTSLRIFPEAQPQPQLHVYESFLACRNPSKEGLRPFISVNDSVTQTAELKQNGDTTYTRLVQTKILKFISQIIALAGQKHESAGGGGGGSHI